MHTIEAEATAATMAAALTLSDIERHNTVPVLVGLGWLCRDIAPVIDRVEQIVREATR